MFLSICIFARQEEGGGGRPGPRELENLVLSRVRTAPQLAHNLSPALSASDTETFSEKRKKTQREYLQFVAKHVRLD